MKAGVSDIIERFPETRIAFLVAEGLGIAEERPAELQAKIEETERRCRAAFNRDEVGQIPGVAAWRQAYKGVGVKKTSYRSSVERLLRNVTNDKPLAAINTLVDCYNRISVEHVMPAGADDLALVEGDICFRFSRDDDNFIPLGQTVADPPKPGEVVYADTAKVLCRRWNWYQDARSAVTPATKRAVLTIQAQDTGDLEKAAAELSADLAAFCGASVTLQIADRGNPTVTF